MLPDAVYLNCDLPSTARALADPELFLSSQKRGAVIALDEVHRLADPSLTLKIAADEYPHLNILATGPSTLAATGKFRDSLTGRKRAIHLCPVLWEECGEPFGVPDFDRRLLHGGLPEALLADTKSPHAFAEWIDSSTRGTSSNCSTYGTARDSSLCCGCCCAAAEAKSTTRRWHP
jgi:hypothetical protein